MIDETKVASEAEVQFEIRQAINAASDSYHAAIDALTAARSLGVLLPTEAADLRAKAFAASVAAGNERILCNRLKVEVDGAIARCDKAYAERDAARALCITLERQRNAADRYGGALAARLKVAEEALRGLVAVMPVFADDRDGPQHDAAWDAARAALTPPPEAKDAEA